MFASTPATAQIGQSLHYLLVGAAMQPSLMPTHSVRMGISQVLWREGSGEARNIALGLIKPESCATAVSNLADRFSQDRNFAAVLTEGVAEKARHNEAFACDLYEAAQTSLQNLMAGGEELPPSSNGRRNRKSDAPHASVWEASVDRLA